MKGNCDGDPTSTYILQTFSQIELLTSLLKGKKARMSTIHIMGLMLPLKTRFLRHLIQFEGKQTGWGKQSLNLVCLVDFAETNQLYVLFW